MVGINIIPSSANIFPPSDDTTPPVTTINFYGKMGKDGWFISKVLINLTASDDLSGVNITFYRINDNDWEIYIKHFDFFDNGVHNIEFYSIDNAGNKENVKSAELRIDQEGPFIDVLLQKFFNLFSGKFFVDVCGHFGISFSSKYGLLRLI